MKKLSYAELMLSKCTYIRWMTDLGTGVDGLDKEIKWALDVYTVDDLYERLYDLIDVKLHQLYRIRRPHGN